MTVEDAAEFFSAIPVIHRRLETLMQVGLGYIRLGQAATTLSGGEAQRVKLARELAKRDTGKTLYIWMSRPQVYISMILPSYSTFCMSYAIRVIPLW
jgi:excinuclease ABC subunit A